MTGCNCRKCNGNCNKLRVEKLEKQIEFLLNARDVRRAIHAIGEPIAEWGFLENYLTRQEVFV